MITKSHDITEEIMMDAACTTVYEFGFENFTTKLWAKKANVSEGSLYYHFVNKEELLVKTFLKIDRLFEKKLEYIFIINAKFDSKKLAAEQIINSYLTFLCRHPVEVCYYQMFYETKFYQEKTKTEQLKDWSELKSIINPYKLIKKETMIEIRFFFMESVHSYAEDLCRIKINMPDDNSDYIRRLLIVVLNYILEEKMDNSIYPWENRAFM